MKTTVNFPSNGLNVVGELYTPEQAGEGRLPAIVVGHPTTGVKEQTAAVYAQKLADQGFLALTFDAAYQGESEGLPRGLEDPFQRAEDFSSAVSYLASRPDVDAENIGVLGICGSGGYAPFAAGTDTRMKAVATVSAADVPSFFRDGDPEGWRQLVAAVPEMKAREAAGEEPVMLPGAPLEVTPDMPEAFKEFHDYYRTPRAQHPRSASMWAASSAAELDKFSAFDEVGRIAPRPLLMIAGTEAITRAQSEDAVSRAGENAELFLVEGASHVDLYDREEPVAQAAAKLGEFFGEHLKA